MEWLFGHRMSPDEMLRKNQRALNKAMRDLDRERLKMEQQEKKVIADIKKLAKEGQMVCSVMASPSWLLNKYNYMLPTYLGSAINLLVPKTKHSYLFSLLNNYGSWK